MRFWEFVDGQSKAWKARKADVLQFWKNLKPNLPIQMEAVPKKHKGTRFRSDGIRITGSPQFINSVLSRLKDVLNLENANNHLDVEYRQIESNGGPDSTIGSPEYVFYFHLVRDDPKFDVPKVEPIPKPKI